MGKKPAPLAERMKTYDAVRNLVKTNPGIRPCVVVRELKEAGNMMPSRETVRRWAVGLASPLTGVNFFTSRPSNVLAFFLGSWLGDGWGDESDPGKRMRLKVRSRSFATEFAHAASSILSKSKEYRVWRTSDKGGPWYNVKVTSMMLYGFVTQDLEFLKQSIEPFPCGFLRGFATAEGCPSISISARRGPRLDVAVAISNSDLELLRFCRELLTGSGFHPGKLRLNFTRGHRTNIGVATKDAWLLNISRLDDVQKFADDIGFADLEKQTKLDEALRLLRDFGPLGGAKRWLELYEKVIRKWVRKN